MATALRRTIIKKFDWLLLGSYVLLVLTGLLMVYTTTYNQVEDQNMWSFYAPFGRQLIWVGIALVALIIAYSIDWTLWNSAAVPFFLCGLSLLVVTLIFGKVVNGARAWIFIGPFSFQPGEMVKFTTAIMFASILSPIKFRMTEPRNQVIAASCVLIPVLLILLQPDPGTAITYFSVLILAYRRGLPTIYYLIGLSLFLTLTISLKYGFELFLALLATMVSLAVLDFKRDRLVSSMIVSFVILANLLLFQLGYDIYAVIINVLAVAYTVLIGNKTADLISKMRTLSAVILLGVISFGSDYAFEKVLKPHQKDRINVWLNPEQCDPRGSLYNLLQSKLAISSGGLSGTGFMNGTFTKYNYVPAQTTDFIFSSIGEEQGFIGSASVVLLYLIMVLRLIKIGESSSSRFVLNYCYVLAGFIFVHFFINIGMTMGLAPVIGIPLPFISIGGSALITFSGMIGIALRMSKSTV